MSDHDEVQTFHEPIEFSDVEVQPVTGKKRRSSQLGQVKPGFIAILGAGYVEAKSKRELRKLLDAGGHQDAVIIRGKIMPTARVTRLAF